MVGDLGAFLKKCKANGERLVLFIDANEGMTNGHMQRMLSSEDLGMREAAMSCHPSLPKMSTYMHQPGKNPIDGCWLTDDIPALSVGWLAVHKCPGDHRVMMVDIDANILLGENILRIIRPPARRLSCRIPRVQKHYIRRVSVHFKQHKVLPRLYHIYANIQGPLSPAQQVEIEEIDRIKLEGMKYAEKKCRKLAMGQVDFLPEISKAN
jgi:hypothetical protein